MTNLKSYDTAKFIRVESLKMVHRTGASHIGSALSIADIVAVLYEEIMKIDPDQPDWAERDRFILSKGHACVAIYSVLAYKGVLSKADLLDYGKDGSMMMNHISHKVDGVEFSSGSLGHGLPFGVGKAIAAKREKKDWRTFVLMSDGELDEGSNWEAFIFAAHHRLDNLIAIIDYNKLQSLARVDETLRLEPLTDKFKSFGWSVREADGHDHDKLLSVLKGIPWDIGKPSVLIAHTVKGKGISFMEDQVSWHYHNPNEEQLVEALAEVVEDR